MTITDKNTDHGHYEGLPLLADVLRRYDYVKEQTKPCCFVETLNRDEVIALGEVGENEGDPSDARSASDFMWAHMPIDERYQLADALQFEAVDYMVRYP